MQFLKFAYPNSEFTFAEIAHVLNRGINSVCSKANHLKLNRPLPEILPDGYKRCSKCKVVAPFDYFFNHKKSKLGKTSWCKECYKIYNENKSNPDQTDNLKEEITLKKCIKCKETKLLNEFHRDSQSKDGYRNYCRDCQRIMRRKYTIKGGY